VTVGLFVAEVTTVIVMVLVMAGTCKHSAVNVIPEFYREFFQSLAKTKFVTRDGAVDRSVIDANRSFTVTKIGWDDESQC